MSEMKPRTVAFYKDYFSDFFQKQKQKVKDKILWTIKLIESQEQIPTDYLKHIEATDGLYEIRAGRGAAVVETLHATSLPQRPTQRQLPQPTNQK